MIPGRSVHVRVPASSANLGPGFDCAGLALELYDDVTVEVTDSGLIVAVEGEGCDGVPLDEKHLIVASLRATFHALDVRPPGLKVTCCNRIPHARGLGSSSAAIVAAVVAARALVQDGDERLGDVAALRLADRLEGHPDNVAACLLGGLTLAWSQASGASAVRLPVHADLAPVVFVPATSCSTQQVRGLLPAAVPHGDAAFNAARAALLTRALTADPGLLMTATQDRLHQGYRAQAMPATTALVGELRADGVAAVTSGAGPSVLALALTGERAGLLGPRAGWTVLPLDVADRGAYVVSTTG